jgi:hypothetical protein
VTVVALVSALGLPAIVLGACGGRTGILDGVSGVPPQEGPDAGVDGPATGGDATADVAGDAELDVAGDTIDVAQDAVTACGPNPFDVGVFQCCNGEPCRGRCRGPSQTCECGGIAGGCWGEGVVCCGGIACVVATQCSY